MIGSIGVPAMIRFNCVFRRPRIPLIHGDHTILGRELLGSVMPRLGPTIG